MVVGGMDDLSLLRKHLNVELIDSSFLLNSKLGINDRSCHD